jgi:hypothetical protein
MLHHTGGRSRTRRQLFGITEQLTIRLTRGPRKYALYVLAKWSVQWLITEVSPFLIDVLGTKLVCDFSAYFASLR